MAIDVLCAGIIVADHVCTPIPHVPRAGELVMADGMLLTIGGCAANAAVDLAKMGVQAAVAGRVGDDIFGRVVAELLGEAGIDTSAIKVSAGSATSQTLIVNVQGEDRRFIHIFGANSAFRPGDIPASALQTCKVLYLGGFLLMPELKQDELIPIFKQARSRGIKVVVDVAIPKPGDYLPLLDRVLPHVDVFLPNSHEGELITGEKDPVRQAQVFARLGVHTAVITMGGEGAVLVQKDCTLHASAFQVPYVDGSGGGDAFDAGYIYGLLQGEDAEGCLRYASALGASCVRAIGTTPGVFTRAECEAFLRENPLEIRRIA